MTPIKVQFLHQHKDKVVYDGIIFDGSLRIENWYGKDYLVFEMPITIAIYKRGFIQRWLKSNRFCRLTRRVLRLIAKDGTTIYQLPEKRFKAELDTNDDKYNFWVVRITCSVSKDEIHELAKIFQK